MSTVSWPRSWVRPDPPSADGLAVLWDSSLRATRRPGAVACGWYSLRKKMASRERSPNGEAKGPTAETGAAQTHQPLAARAARRVAEQGSRRSRDPGDRPARGDPRCTLRGGGDAPQRLSAGKGGSPRRAANLRGHPARPDIPRREVSFPPPGWLCRDASRSCLRIVRPLLGVSGGTFRERRPILMAAKGRNPAAGAIQSSASPNLTVAGAAVSADLTEVSSERTPITERRDPSCPSPA